MTINSYALLTEKMLADLIDQGNLFFVRQAFWWGWQEGLKGAFMITPYKHQENAHEHFIFLNGSRDAFLYSVFNNEHFERLHIAAAQPAGYLIYVPFFSEQNWTMPVFFIEQKVLPFLKQHYGWIIEQPMDVNIQLAIKFGDIHLKVRWQEKETQIDLDILDNSAYENMRKVFTCYPFR